jgi:hypothetical protein
MTTFSRRQLIDRDYNPLEDPEEIALREQSPGGLPGATRAQLG